VTRPEATSERGGGPGDGISREILEGVRRRDREALSVFFDRYARRVYDVAYRMLGERAAAEDVTQEVFLRVWRAADKLDPDRVPDPWVLRIARNVCRDVWRSKHHQVMVRSRRAEDADDVGALPSPAPDPERATSEAERRRAVQSAILALPPGFREVVVLHDYRGLSHPEIAEILGTSHAAVRKRYSRALAKLGESLEGLIP